MADAFPLQWPHGVPRAKTRQDSNFRVHHSTAYDEMMRELELFGARNVVVSTNIPLRRDGTPYRDGMAELLQDSGVAVWFMRKQRQICLPCDSYRRPWENIRAISKSIEAMRSMERHGAHQILDQAFTGFAALPPPDGKKPWHEVLGVQATAKPAEISEARKQLARQHKGNEAMMSEINVAHDEGMQVNG
jgi:hypothetical protein